MYCTCAKSTKALLSKNILTNILSIQHMDLENNNILQLFNITENKIIEYSKYVFKIGITCLKS